MNETLVNDILKSGGTTLMVIKAEDLKKAICETVSETRRQMENEVAMSKSETYLTGQQVQDKLNVSRTTLWNWRKEGYLVPRTSIQFYIAPGLRRIMISQKS